MLLNDSLLVCNAALPLTPGMLCCSLTHSCGDPSAQPLTLGLRCAATHPWPAMLLTNSLMWRCCSATHSWPAMLLSHSLLVCIADLRSLPYFNAAHQPHHWPAISLTCSLPPSNAARQPLTPGFAAHFHPSMLISLLNHSLRSSNAYQPA